MPEALADVTVYIGGGRLTSVIRLTNG